MIKEAIDRILELAEPRVIKIGDKNYSNKQLIQIKPDAWPTLTVRSLSGMVGYLTSRLDSVGDCNIIIETPDHVRVFGAVDDYGRRNNIVEANAPRIQFEFGKFYDVETMIIKLQTCFYHNGGHQIEILKLISSVKEEDVATWDDDGVSQTVMAKSGIAKVKEVPIQNPVILQPYNTFLEVEQPIIPFILRAKKGPYFALFEVDGGMWKIETMQSIKKWLENSLEHWEERLIYY